MSSRSPYPRARWFFGAFVLVTLLLAGAVSYFADSDPDGLEAVTGEGCVEVAGALAGDCPARHARDHDLADSPLADYALGGDGAFTGVAGVLGVLATLAVATALFRLLARTGRPAPGPGRPGGGGGNGP